jgi:extracellular matrix regulatory protein B
VRLVESRSEGNMYIHIGNEKIIRGDELIAIVDVPAEGHRETTQEFIDQEQKQKQIEKIGEEETKSLVITDSKLYYSPISSATLRKRAETNALG